MYAFNYLLYFIIILKFILSKSLNFNNDSFNFSSSQKELNKNYIVVFKDIIEDISENNHLNKRMEYHNNLKSKYNMLTIKYPLYDSLNKDHNLLKKRNDLNYSNSIQKVNIKERKTPLLLKSFMFINEDDIIKEVYGSNKDINLLKRSENREFTIKEFLKSVNSSEAIIDYIEEDFPVFSDDISNNEYNHYMNFKKRFVMKESFLFNNSDEIMDENTIYSDNIEIQKKNLDWVIYLFYSYAKIL